MQYPREWEEVDNEILGGYDTKNAIVEFLPSNESAYFRQDDQSTHESLALVVANYENNSGSVTKQLSDFGNQRKSFVKLTCPDFRILYENTNATLSNDNPAHRMVYKYSHGGIVYMATEIWTIKNGKSYLLAFGGQESSYVNFLPEIENVFKSFKIIAQMLIQEGEPFRLKYCYQVEYIVTVGYGDLYPVTLGGKIVAAMLMVVGIAILGGLISTLGAGLIESRFLRGDKKRGKRTAEPSLADALLQNEKSWLAICLWTGSGLR